MKKIVAMLAVLGTISFAGYSQTTGGIGRPKTG
jgi:hypothetical protein